MCTEHSFIARSVDPQAACRLKKSDCHTKWSNWTSSIGQIRFESASFGEPGFSLSLSFEGSELQAKRPNRDVFACRLNWQTAHDMWHEASTCSTSVVESRVSEVWIKIPRLRYLLSVTSEHEFQLGLMMFYGKLCWVPVQVETTAARAHFLDQAKSGPKTPRYPNTPSPWCDQLHREPLSLHR